MSILLVEDDMQLGESLEAALRPEQYAVDWLRNGGRFVSRARLEEGIYSWGEEVGSNTVKCTSPACAG